MKKKEYQIQFQWTFAHEDILGNELAHQVAMEATIEDEIVNTTNDLLRLYLELD